MAEVFDDPMSLIYGYARPTAPLSDSHALAEQLAAAGADVVLAEKHDPAAGRGLPQRRRLLARISSGDTLILPSLDHLGTAFDDLVRCFSLLVERGIEIRILDTGFDTSGAHTEAYRGVLRQLVAAHSALHGEAVKRGLAAARAKSAINVANPEIQERL